MVGVRRGKLVRVGQSGFVERFQVGVQGRAAVQAQVHMTKSTGVARTLDLRKRGRVGVVVMCVQAELTEAVGAAVGLGKLSQINVVTTSDLGVSPVGGKDCHGHLREEGEAHVCY